MSIGNIRPAARLLIRLAEEFYTLALARTNSRFSARHRCSAPVDKDTLTELFQNDALSELMTEFGDSQFPLIRRLENGKYELHSFFKDFLRENCLRIDGAETKQRLARRLRRPL